MATPIDPGHYPDQVLLALVHAQPFEGALAAQAHVHDCRPCGQRLRALAAEDTLVGDILAALDHAAPVLDVPALRRAGGRARRRGVRAAAAAVMLGTAALAALPASPLHQLLFPTPDQATASPPTTSNAPAHPALASGIAVPSSASVEIRFMREQRSGTIEIRRVATPDVAVRARGGTTAYDLTQDAIVVDNVAPAETYQVDLPRTVRELRITVGDRMVLHWPADSGRSAVAGRTGVIQLPLATTTEAP